MHDLFSNNTIDIPTVLEKWEKESQRESGKDSWGRQGGYGQIMEQLEASLLVMRIIPSTGCVSHAKNCAEGFTGFISFNHPATCEGSPLMIPI